MVCHLHGEELKSCTGCGNLVEKVKESNPKLSKLNLARIEKDACTHLYGARLLGVRLISYDVFFFIFV
jgi:hypothetical protein